MKKTFSTTFFRRALFLVLLFGGVTNLWGETFSYDFTWSSTNGANSGVEYISDDGKYTYQVNSGSWRKETNDGDVLWSKEVENNIKRFTVSSKNYTCTTENPYFRARNTHYFSKGNYTITINFLVRYSEQSTNAPSFFVGEYQASTDVTTIPYNSGNETTVTYTVNIKQAGDYYFQGRFGSQENVGFQTATFTKAAATTRTVYLNLNSFHNWKDECNNGCAKFAVYSWDDNGNKWSEYMELVCGESYIYSTEIPLNHSKAIFCRMNPSEGRDWDGKWNQTGDLESVSDANNCCKITNWDAGSLEKYTPKTYTITFDGNGSTSGSMTAITNIDCGGSATLPANTFKKTGYKFSGWKDASNNSYADKAKLTDIQSNITLTAQWAESSCPAGTEKFFTQADGGWSSSFNAETQTITFDGDWTACSFALNATSSQYEKIYIKLASPVTNVGKLLIYNDQGCSTEKLQWTSGNDIEIPLSTYGDFSYIGFKDQNKGSITFDCFVLVPKSYTITYNAGTGATGSIASGTKFAGENYTLSTETFTRDGYQQVGWATSDGGSKAYDLGGTYSTDANITLYPVWEELHNITLYLKPTHTDWSGNYFRVYYFGNGDGWSDLMTLTCAGSNVYTIDIPDNNYTKVIFCQMNNNTETGWGAKQYQTTDLVMPTTNTLFEVTGHPDGSNYTGSWSQYTPKTFNITYQSGEGSEDADQVEIVNCGDDHIVIANPFEAKSINYEFTGWKENSTDYAPGAVLSNVTTNHTLMAQWSYTQSYTITVESSDDSKGTVSGSGTYLHGETVTLIATPTTGNEFVSWSDGDTENPRVFTATENLTLTATFRKSTKVCTNTLTIEAEDETKMITTDKTSAQYGINTDWEKKTTKSEVNALITSASGTGLMAMLDKNHTPGPTNNYIYYAFETSGPTDLSISVTLACCDGDKKGIITIYSTKATGGESCTYNETPYKQYTSFDAPLNKNNYTWITVNQSLGTSPADKYIIAVKSSDGDKPIMYDKFTITASDDVFCTEAPTTCTAPTSVSLSNGKTDDWGYFGGETITLTATPNGGSTPTGYQWYFNDNEISGATSDTYTINSCSVENGGDYKCKIITGDDCSCTSPNYGIKVYALRCYTNGTFTYNFTRNGNSKIGTLILAREENYYYEYKIVTGSEHYGNNGRISRDVLDWTFEKDKDNVKFDAGFIAGDYTFTINYTDNGGAPKLSVMYPRRSVFVGLCSDWKSADAKYAIYYVRKSNSDDNGWTGWMSAPDCDNDTRVASDVPIWADKYVICRYNSSTDSPGSWESGTLWGQTCDIDADASKNYYTNLVRWDNDKKYHGEWSTYFVETSYNVSAGHKIFFDNSSTQWSNVYFRIGRKCYSSKYDMTLVPGTQSLYQYSIPQWDNYVAFHVADNRAQEGDGKNIYDVRPGSYNIDNCTSFIKEAITEDFTIRPTTTSGGSLPNYYDYDKSNGMLTHKVTLGEVANGTINVEYTDVAGSAQNLTSGSADLAHTCVLTITFTPAQGHHKTSFQVNGQDFTSGSQLILTENITISATCAINQHTLTWITDGDALTGDYTHGTVDYGISITAPNTPTKTGYTFAGWHNGSSVVTPATTMPDNNVTYTATWNINHYTLTWAGIEGATLKTAGTEAGEVNFGTNLTAPVYEKTGYTFAGWNPAVAATMPAAATTYTAQWTAKTYDLTLDKNEGSANGRVTVTYDSNTTSEFSAPTRDNYIIKGFYAEQGYTTKVMNADGTLCTSVENYTDASGNWVKDEACTLYTKWAEKPKVDALIVTGDVNSATHNDGSASFTYTHTYDAFFGHKVLKIEYSGMSGSWGNSIISIDNGYQSSSSTGATGFGLWYKTDAGVTSIAFCLDYGTQKKTQLPGTNGAWKYVYVKSSNASGWSGSDITIWMNGQDNDAAKGEWTPSTLPHNKETTHTNPSSGVLYISEIRATEITEKFINYTVTFTPPSQGSTSAQIKDGATINSGDEVPEGTEVIFTWEKATDYEFDNFSDGTNTYTQNPCTLTVNNNLTITTTVEVEATKHTLTASSAGNGSVSPAGETQVGEGREVIITATPESHYGFASWTAIGITLTPEQEKQNPLTITMPTNDVTLTASFEYVYVDAMIVTGNSATTDNESSGSGGSVTPTSVTDPNGFFDHNVWEMSYTMPSGGYAGIHINCDAGYTPASSNGATGFGFYYKTEPGQTIAFCLDPKGQQSDQRKTQLPSTNGFWKYAYVESNLASNWNHSNIIIYQNATDNASGTWTPSALPGSGGTTTTPSTGKYYIAEICATERTTKPEETPVYTATFVADPLDKATVTATVDAAAITSGDAVDAGKLITFNYSNVEANYRFDGWTATGISLTDAQKQEHPLTITMPSASITLTANFVRVYTLTINSDSHGTATVSPVKDAYAKGESITVTSQPTAGYAFDYYMDGDNKIETDPYEFTMSNSDRTISVHFKESINYYDINTAVSGEGSVAITVGGETHTGQQILEGTQVTLTATASDESHGFSQWQDGNKDNPRTIIANETNAAITWTATFALRHTVTATFGKPGTKVTGQGEYATGAQVTLEAQWTLASKDFTYGFKEWTNLDGVYLSDEQKVSNPVVFSMPSSNVSMKATFAPVECVDTFVIQCEDDLAYIPWNKQDEDLTKYPNSIPHDGQCGPYHDYYNGYHSSGYYDYKSARSAEMYYPIELPASTYKFEIWSASNGYKNCWMNLYVESDDANPDVVYKGVNYKKTNNVTANNDCGAGGDFAISGTIENVVINSPKSVIIGLYCGEDYGSFDQIVIIADDAVFCEEKDIETFTILSTESKEIPVSGVKNLVVYEGGQATNEDDVEVFETVKYIRSITEQNIDMWYTFAVPYTATKTQVSKGKSVDDIYPVYRMQDQEQVGYYFMEVLTNINQEAIGIESRARWDMSYTRQPQKDSAYITMFPRAQSDGYFIGSEIFYIGDYTSNGGVTLTGSNKARIENGGWPETGKPKYYYFPNSAITAIYPYDAYVLNEDHTMFVLTDHPTILPFQCYIQATTEFKEMYPRIAIRKKDDGGGVTTELIPIAVEEMNAAHVEKFIKDDIIYILRDNKIYTIMGQPVK